MRRKTKTTSDLVRVIRDVRDGTRDYWMDRDEAKKLFDAGKLIMVNCYSGRWDYATP